MVELAGDEAERGEVANFGERGEQRIGAEDPKHIEAPEGIEGDEAWGRGRGSDGSAHTGVGSGQQGASGAGGQCGGVAGGGWLSPRPAGG